MSAAARLREYSWPGNVRELNAVLTRAAIMFSNPLLNKQDIDQAIAEMSSKNIPNIFSVLREPGFKLEDRLEKIEKHFINVALLENDFNQKTTAKVLGVKYLTLNRRIREFGIITDGEK